MQRTHRGVALDTVFDENGTCRGIPDNAKVEACPHGLDIGHHWPPKMSQRNWMRPSIGLAVFTAVVRKGSIGQRGCSGNGLYSGYSAGLEGPQLERC